MEAHFISRLELALGLFSWVVIGAVAWMHRRREVERTARDTEFERFCEGQPALFAVRCREAHANRVARFLERRIGGKREIANPYGKAPWPVYRVRVEVRRPAPGVLVVHAERGEVMPEGQDRPEPIDLLRGLGAELAHVVEAVWLHGQLFAEGRHAYLDRDRVGWSGSYDERGRLGIETMVGAPSWIRAQPKPQRLAA